MEFLDTYRIRKLAKSVRQQWDGKHNLELCSNLNIRVYWNDVYEYTRIVNRGPVGEISYSLENCPSKFWHQSMFPGGSYILMHSLGHLFVHCRYLQDDNPWVYEDAISRRSPGYNIEEYQANCFAQELLLPDDHFYSLIDGKRCTRDLAEITGYPEWVIEDRLKMGRLY